jgi:formamidopyrimidine-DNA glycosylase
MPELPEVETVRQGVERLLVGKTIQSVEILKPKILKPPVTDPLTFGEKMIGSTLVNARRRGKHLIFGLDNGYALYAHLNMRGQIVVAQNSAAERRKYLCAVVGFNSGQELRYHDIWTWGELRLLPDHLDDIVASIPALASMGVEPLSEGFNSEVLKSRARKKSGSPIKTVLLDQSVAAGLGNIYADEALFRSGICPLRKTGTLDEVEWDLLAKQIVAVLNEAVHSGGTLSDNYVDVDGVVGRYQPQVYGRLKAPCVRCHTTLTGSRLAGRSTVYCPNCQK